MESVNGVKARLARLESRLQSIIEGGAARLFPFSAAPSDLAPLLISALQAGVKTRADGQRIAPNLFTLIVHPGQVEALQNEPRLLESLAEAIQETAKAEGLVCLHLPKVQVLSDPEVAPRQIHVAAQISSPALEHTADLEVEADDNATNIPENAFLIVNGMGIFSLTQSVINIGRRSDNQLVIDDVRVSRVHAQLRAIKGRYVVFDLGSTGGTFVNEKRVTQSVLFPGDVILLAGLPLVFGQDTSSTGQTQKFDPLE